MSGIFVNNGVPPAAATNSYTPTLTPNTGCPVTYYSNNCDQRIDPDSLNSTISEIVAVVDGLSQRYDCGIQTNLLNAIKTYIDNKHKSTVEANTASQVLVYNTPGTYNVTAPNGAIGAFVNVNGGGASGSARQTSTAAGYGGSAGGYSGGVVTITASEIVTVTIGSGGAASANSYPNINYGGSSTFVCANKTITATGGTLYDTGGYGNGGDIILTGSDGQPFQDSGPNSQGGYGGAGVGPWGGGGTLGQNTTGPVDPAETSAGGGGAGIAAGVSGGKGGDGQIVIEWFF